MLRISSNFDSGSIEVLDASTPSAVRLALRKDHNSHWIQWFYFRVTGARGIDCTFRIENASQSRWHKGWSRYRVLTSYDRQEWVRLATDYDGTSLIIRHRPEYDSVYYAYAVPYPRERDRDFVARCQVSARVRLEVLGETLDGDDLDLLVVGQPGPGKRVCWIVTRHHPGETQGPYSVEGLMGRLLDEADPVARELLAQAVFYVVPDINPDGTRRGHHRTNAAGTDLNRAWTDTTMEASPEVYLVRERMRQTGVDFCLDLHAAESVEYVWPVGTPGIPSISEHQLRLRAAFDAALLRATPDYGPTRYNQDNAPGTDPLAMAISWTAEHMGSLSLILEFPFIDNADAPDARYGWSPERSRRFGAAILDALYAVIGDLR